LLKSLAYIVRGRNPYQEFESIDEALDLFGQMIEPIRQSFARTQPGERSEEIAAILDLLSAGPMTAGEVKAAASRYPKLAKLAGMTAIKVGLHLKEIDGRVVGRKKLVGRRDAHRKQMVWTVEAAGG